MSPGKNAFFFSRQEWALIGVTMIWGTTFLIVSKTLTVTGPLFFVGLRFAFATLSVFLISPRTMLGLTRRELFAGLAIGVAIFIGYAFQTVGLQTISSSKSAFIFAFYIPMVPLLQWLFMRRRPTAMQWVGVVLALAGLVMITSPEQTGAGMGKGEILTLVGTIGTAVEILLIGHFAGSVNLQRVTVVQLMLTSVLSFSCMGPMGESVPSFSWLLAASAFGIGLSTAIIQIGMNWAQKTVSPTRATIIYAGEPVWAGIWGKLAGEFMPPAAILGGALVVLGVLVSELRIKFAYGKRGAPRANDGECSENGNAP